MLGPNFKEASEDVIRLKNVDGPTLRKIIHYIYAGHIELTDENVESVLSAASNMELVMLEEICEKYLEEHLNGENCLQVLMLAEKYNLTKSNVKSNALKSVCDHFESIPKADMMHVGGNILAEIFQYDGFRVPEEQIYNCVVEWSKQDEVARAAFVPNILRSVRLEHIPWKVTSRAEFRTIIEYD